MVYGANDFALSIGEDTCVVPLQLREAGAPVDLSIYPATGHGVALAGFEDYLLQFRRKPYPKSISCYTDENNPWPVRNYWVTLLTLADPDLRAGILADVVESHGAQLVIQTVNVSEFSLDLGELSRARSKPVKSVAIDGQALTAPEGEFVRFVRDDFTWRARGVNSRPQSDPTRYRAGGIENLYAEGSALIVAPADLMEFAAKLSHRTVMGSSTWVSIPVRLDTEVTDDELRANHLFLVGGPSLNRAAARLAASEQDWPLPVEDGAVVLDKKRKVPLDASAVTAVTYNPLNRARRVFAILTDSKDAFANPESVLLRGRGSRRRRPDIQVIDIKENAVVEQRLMTDEWKPRGYRMPLD